jgi:hypothetical protein
MMSEGFTDVKSAKAQKKSRKKTVRRFLSKRAWQIVNVSF